MLAMLRLNLVGRDFGDQKESTTKGLHLRVDRCTILALLKVWEGIGTLFMVKKGELFAPESIDDATNTCD